MSDLAPQLGDIPRMSELNVPTLSSQHAAAHTDSHHDNDAAAATAAGTASTFVNNAQSAINTVANHPITQNVKDTMTNVKDTVTNGPVAESVKNQTAQTSSEFRSLAGSRQVPDSRAATGQPLTHYHSFFYNLLTWKHPRATGLSFLGVVTAIFMFRYLPILRLTFKGLSWILGVMALVEGAGQVMFKQSLVSAVRPKKYFTIPRESLEASLEDVEQLLNFFVIEIQRIVFAENAAITFAAFLASFIGYWLIKFTPVWGLALIAVTTIYLSPLIYISNKHFIDEQLAHASKVVNAQAAQVKDLAATHTANATESIKGYAGDYSAKAQELIGSARLSVAQTASKALPSKTGPNAPPAYADSDFPHAPKQEPAPGVNVTPHQVQYEESRFGGHAEPAY